MQEITVTSNGRKIGTINNAKVLKEVPEKGVKLVHFGKNSKNNFWMKDGTDSIEFSKLHIAAWSEDWGILKSSDFFVTAKAQIEESRTTDIDRKKSQLINFAYENYTSGINLLKKLEIPVPDDKKDFDTFKNSIE